MTVTSSWIIPLTPTDSPETILQKAALVVPHPRQVAWQAMELTAFIHFGVNTFSGREWGTGLEDPASFNPTDLDARQWTRVLKSAGFKQVVLTAKHHDGFCLWPSRYTDYSVKRSPWRNGQGDVLRELVDAARADGLKVGLYLSPADLHEMEAPGGRYGNGSPVSESAIPSLLPGDARQPAQTFHFACDDYNRYYLNQLYEILTEYGPIHEVWFDGANPKPGVAESYNYADWFSLVRALAPEAVMFNGPDLRWVGNESGLARADEWSVLPFTGDPAPGLRPLDPLSDDLGSRARLAPESSQADIDPLPARYLAWYPAEVDVSIRPGWFYHEEEDTQVKSLDQLMHIYEYSVGRNGLLLLNIPPDRRGRFADPDCQRLLEFCAELQRIYQVDLAACARLAEGGTPAPDGQPQHAWSPPAGQTSGELILELPQPATINRVLLQEQILTGQHVESFAIDAWQEGSWREIVTGGTIGYKRILATRPFQARRLRLRILASRATPAILRLGLFHS